MNIETFDLERGQSLWENRVEVNLSESGVHPVTLAELATMGLDLDALIATPLAYVQTNGSPELRAALCELYPGAVPDQIEVTNGTSEANYLLAQVLIEPGDEVLVQVPNYLQIPGIARALGATVETFSLRPTADRQSWSVDWQELEEKVSPRTRLIYLSHPNNPTGMILDESEIARLVALAERHGAWIIADQIYRGTEHDGRLSPSFWGLGERVVVTAGLSKSYGIPGARIGWIAGPEDLVARCWSHHDYTTIAPGALSDSIARFAVEHRNAERLFARARGYMTANAATYADFVAELGGVLEYSPPRAGAYAFSRYHLDIGSVELCDRLRDHRSVLVVPGAWAGLEHHLRIGLGTPQDRFELGLERLGQELATVAPLSNV